jgi:hypothetical protein
MLLTRDTDGRWTLHLGEDERRLLAALAGELEQLLDASPDDPSLRRLHPTAYPKDEEREAGWQILIGEELREKRRAQLEVVRATAERTELDEEEVHAWMQALNALRLVLGTRLDVSEDEDGPLDPEDPTAPAHALYDFLGFLLERTVQSLSAG